MWMNDAWSARSRRCRRSSGRAILSVGKLSSLEHCNPAAPGPWTKGYTGMAQADKTPPRQVKPGKRIRGRHRTVKNFLNTGA